MQLVAFLSFLMARGDLVKQLEGLKIHKYNLAGQYIFQPGANTLMSCDNLWSVNAVNFFADNAGGNQFTPALDDTNTGYIWGQKTTLTLQNHSQLPIYIKVKFIRNKDYMPAPTPGTEGIYEACGNANDFIFKSNTTMVAYAGFIEHGTNVDAGEAANTSSGMFTRLGNQGIYNAEVNGALVTAGEGYNGIAGVADTYAPYSLNLTTVGNLNLLTSGLAVPIGFGWNHSSFFRELYNVYNTKKIVLKPEQSITLAIQDTDIKFIRRDYGSVTFNGATAEFDQWNQWDVTKVLQNKWHKQIVLEVVGSLIGRDPFKSTYNLEGSATGSMNGPAWGPTAAETDNIDIRTVLRSVSTHGGVLRWWCHKEWSSGVLTNEEREQMVGYGWNVNQIGAHDAPLVLHQDAGDH